MAYQLTALKRVFGSVLVSAGILAIANVETIWQEYHHEELREDNVLIKKVAYKSHRAKRVSLNLRPTPTKHQEGIEQQAALIESLERDEIADENPFANLKDLAPLQATMRKGVISFERNVYRSPSYQSESGYDLLTYTVTHPDNSKSTIVVYNEASTCVTFAVADLEVNGEAIDYFLFETGNLKEHVKLTAADADSRFAARLSAAVPFLSVSR